MAVAPPPPMPQKVIVPRGRKVEIPLRIYGRQNEALRYLIKTPPAHGKLSSVREVGRETSAVAYEPPDDLAITADRFTFSVQSTAGVSAPVEVTIAIIDQPAQLAVPESVDFGELLAGGTATKSLELANRGGGLAQGELLVEPPWKIEGPCKYRLGAGELTNFKLTFAPTDGGQFRGEIRYTSDRDHSTALRGSSQAPISAEPAAVVLGSQPDSPLRVGGFEIVNRTPEARTFTLTAGARLHVEKSISVPAGGRVSVPVSAHAVDMEAIEDAVRVEQAGFVLRVPVKAPKVGPILRVASGNIILGRVEATRGAQTVIEVENGGGTVARVTGEISAPFLLPESTFDVAPGEKKQVPLVLQPGSAGRYRTWLKFKGPQLATVELQIEAELVGTPAATAGRQVAKATPKPREEDPAELPPWMPDPDVVRAIKITDLAPTSATILWPADLNEAARYRIERLMLTRDTAHALRKAWIEIPKTTFARDGARWSARLIGLQPQQSQTVRVVPLDAQGGAGQPLFMLDFFTPEKRTAGLLKIGLFQWLLAGLVVCLAITAWKRLRHSLTESPSGF
ncbi:MAG: Flagellar-associated PapD-like [Chthoniobacter sp.]|nr:Flagellar-associated PapD-like [Chthoniobacter sp.]